MSIIDTVFRPVIGKMCWNVKNGVGSSLTFEFGEPHFKVIGEPYLSKSNKPGVIRHAARRRVSIYGDWYLWIWLCYWRFYRNDTFVSDSESTKKDLKQIALDLEGQALVSVKVKRPGISVFKFDLGARLETQRYPEDDEESEPEDQWMLYQLSGMVFTLRSDGMYTYHMGNEPRSSELIPLTEYSG